MDHSNELLNVEEAAKLLRVSPYTLRSWCYQRKLAYQKIGRRVLFKMQVLLDFIEKNTVKPFVSKANALQQ